MSEAEKKKIDELRRIKEQAKLKKVDLQPKPQSELP